MASLTEPLPVVDGAAPQKQVAAVYVVFLGSAAVMLFGLAGQAASATATCAAMSQCLAFCFLSMQSARNSYSAGISVQALVLYILAVACRLASTLRFEGYLPVDATGDYFYQTVDVVAMALAQPVLWRQLLAHPLGLRAAREVIQIIPLVLGAFVAAHYLHADMDRDYAFDTIWFAGRIMAASAAFYQVARLPYCCPKENLISHAIAALCMSHIFDAIFVWLAKDNVLSAFEWIEGFNHAPWAIIATHVVPLILFSDFSLHTSDDWDA